MRTITRILATSGLTGMIAALAFAAPAGATGVDRLKGACLATGTVKLNPPIPFTGGSGSYVFNGLVRCVVVEQAKGALLQGFGLVELDVTSPGNYTNLVCGTGKAVSGNATVNTSSTNGGLKTNTTTEWQTVANSLDYTVEFILLQGLLKWTDSSGQKLSVDVPKLLTPGPTGFPGGYVVILPDPFKASPLPGACTKAFQVSAALVIDWSPTNPIV